MKRVISIFLTLALLIGCFVISVSAADNSNYFDVLNYCTLNDSGSNFISLSDSNNAVFRFGFTSIIYDIEFVFTCIGSVPSSLAVSFGGRSFPLTISHIGDSLYRATGFLDGYADNALVITSSSSISSYYNFLHIYAFSVSSSSFSDSATCNISTQDYSGTINYVDGGSDNFKIFIGTSDFNYNSLNLYLYSDNWKKYDVLQFLVVVDCIGIASVSASYGGGNLPLEVSFIDNVSTGGYYIMSLSIDVSSIDNSSSDYPQIIITGTIPPSETCSVGILNFTGIVFTDQINPIIFWFQKLFYNLDSWFDGVVISIETWGQNIVAAFSPDDNGSADQFQESVSSQAGELSGIADAMGSLDKPDPVSLNVNLDSFAVNANLSGVGSVLAVPMRNDIILQVLIMTFTFALVGYALFGKR